MRAREEKLARRDENNRTKLWNRSEIPGLSLLRADFTTQSFAPHFHEALVVAVTEFGGARIRSRGVVGTAMTASLYAFNPGEPHSGDMGGSERWCYRGFYLPYGSLELLRRELDIDEIPYFLENSFKDTELIGKFVRLHKMLEGRWEDSTLEAFLEAFALLFQRHGSHCRKIEKREADSEYFLKARQLISERYHEQLSLSEIAEPLGLSTFQLIALFKRHSGMTPHAYLTQVRLRTACQQLSRGKQIVDVALENGFYDQSALNKHFKRSFAITPLQFLTAAGFKPARRPIEA